MVRAHSNSLRGSLRGPGVPLPFVILKPWVAVGSCVHLKLWNQVWVLLWSLLLATTMLQVFAWLKIWVPGFFRLLKERAVIDWTGSQFMVIGAESPFLGSLTITCFLSPMLRHSTISGIPFCSVVPPKLRSQCSTPRIFGFSFPEPPLERYVSH